MEATRNAVSCRIAAVWQGHPVQGSGWQQAETKSSRREGLRIVSYLHCFDACSGHERGVGNTEALLTQLERRDLAPDRHYGVAEWYEYLKFCSCE